jgi:uncharacterized protein YbaR (Trm112 family)
MTTSVSCSWCHAMNDSTIHWCVACGHDAQQPRILCRRPQCQRTYPIQAEIPPAPPEGDHAP